MGLEKEKEEIIELTEVLEEGPAFAAKNDRRSACPPTRKTRKPPSALRLPSDSLSALPDSKARMMKEALARQAENWAAREGARLVERLAADFIPRIVDGETVLGIGEAQSRNGRPPRPGGSLLPETGGMVFLRRPEIPGTETREAVPRVAAEALHPEIEALKKEIEKIQAQRRRTEPAGASVA